MARFLPYGRQQIDKEDVAAVVECLRDDFLTTGPRVAAFEAALREVTEAEHAVACANGTAALHLASLAIGLGPGDQVVVPTLTFLSTANAPRLAGAEIVFADVDPESGLMTADTLSEALDRAPRARAVFPVHLNGAWVAMPDVRAAADRRGLAVIEDACHALGTSYLSDERPCAVGDGRHADLVTFSFHPVKAIAMGEGGAVTTRNAELARRVRSLANHGITRTPEEFSNQALATDPQGLRNPWYYEMQELGLNYRVPDILCALGTSQLRKLPGFIARRRQLASLYDQAIAGMAPAIRPVARPPGCASAFHLYVVLIEFEKLGRSRAQVMDSLRAEGVGTQVHYLPVHLQPYYRDMRPDLRLKGAEAYYARALSLPIHPGMKDKDVRRVVDALHRTTGSSTAPTTSLGRRAQTLGQAIGTTSPLDEIVRQRPRIVVFLPNTNELQRFVLAGAFDELSKDHDLHYVVPTDEAGKMRSAAPDTLRESNTCEIQVLPERFKKWSRLFQAACFRYASLSPSFAIRANLALRPGTSRVLRLLPESTWSFSRRIAARLLPASWLPGSARRRLKRVHDVLGEAEAQPELFRNVHADRYEAMVTETLEGMEPLSDIVNVFDRLNPLYAIIPSSLLDVFCSDVLWACEAEDVACVVLQSGWDNLSSKGIIHHRPTFLGCWGEQSVGHAKEIQGLSRSITCALGAPHYEFLRPAGADEVAQLRQELGVASSERLVLFGGSFRQFDETGMLQRLEAAIEAGRLGAAKVLYRPHPWRAARKHEEDFFRQDWKHVIFDPDMRERYVRERQEAGYIKREVPMYDMAYLARILSASDAVISPMSTLLIEALIMERPTMAIAFGDDKHSHDPSVTAQMTHFAEARSSGALIWCDDATRFEADCSALLEPELANKLAEQRRKLVDQVVVTAPGTYAERLARFCRETVERDARKLRGRRAGRKRGTITHAYGANLIASDYCGVTSSEPQVPGYWMHGWIPAYHNVDPALIALHKKDGQHEDYDYEAQIREEKEKTQQWVSRQDQAEYLSAHGYRQVKAIGLPIVYIPDLDVQRVPGSLLVMPPHSHKNHGPGDALAELYASVIADLSPEFEHIWVGLNEDDLAKNQWVEAFRRHSIGIFPTTDQSDRRTLVRLKRILSTFEYVTTNGFGSHIALAAYCGARVSVFGPYADFPKDRMARTHAVKMFPRLLDTAYYLCTEDALREHYPFLFVDPREAGVHREWGAFEVGEPQRLSPPELAELFGWSPARTDSSGSPPSSQLLVGRQQASGR